MRAARKPRAAPEERPEPTDREKLAIADARRRAEGKRPAVEVRY
jgi:hypothetical protein